MHFQSFHDIISLTSVMSAITVTIQSFYYSNYFLWTASHQLTDIEDANFEPSRNRQKEDISSRSDYSGSFMGATAKFGNIFPQAIAVLKCIAPLISHGRSSPSSNLELAITFCGSCFHLLVFLVEGVFRTVLKVLLLIIFLGGKQQGIA